jgi:hypothetical protein
MASNWLSAWSKPSLPGGDVGVLQNVGKTAFSALSDGARGLAARLCTATPPSEALPRYSAHSFTQLYMPTRNTLACVIDRDEHLNLCMGMLAMGLAANVGGQGRRFAQAKRRFKRDGDAKAYASRLEQYLSALLCHLDRAEAARRTLDWELPTDSEERMNWCTQYGVDAHTKQLDPAQVTRTDPANCFFFEKSFGDLLVYLALRRFGSTVNIVPTTGLADYPSVYKLMQALAQTPPRQHCLYAVAQSGMALPPPFICVAPPLDLPNDEECQRQWHCLLRVLKAFSEGLSTVNAVQRAIDRAIACNCTQRRCVMQPETLVCLQQTPSWYAAVGKGHDESARGAVALFRGSELQLAQ